ncbi:tetratricopeptide repeat protein [Desertivirga xinjiangensis]|uniref:tetratricopeptide repeat protein n=1 Tax=Desertivirga xinjiangensis TaxID=539206 RepID=UPI00210C9E9E|nr:tetratricopeptide repeat protein [Pedobacter xinjiangensis]
MKIKLLLFLYFLNQCTAYCQQQYRADSLQVENLNALSYKIRLTDPRKTINTGKQALEVARKINFELGMAEAYRVIGIGYAYLGENDTAIAKYSMALSLFKTTRYGEGEAKVYNNIGNLYKYYDVEKSLNYFQKCLKISQKLNLEELTAGCYINIAHIQIKQEKYDLALKTLNQSHEYFQKTKNSVGTALILQYEGIIYEKLNQHAKAKDLLTRANELAKKKKFYNNVGSINLTLASIYIREKNYQKAQDLINEGIQNARLSQDKKLEEDYIHTSYELEFAKKNYEQALMHLRKKFKIDSIALNSVESKKITLHQEQFKFIEQQKQTEILLERQKTSRVIFAATAIVLLLSLVVITLLVLQSKKRAKTYRQLRELNEEISLQRENLNRVNQNQELIIKERTQDLEDKNFKLSQYSSHLSHEIRSPIATIKGLLILEEEDLMEDKELIQEIRKSIEDIDNKLMNINHMLHNPKYKTFVISEKGDNDVPPSGE